MEEDPRFAKFQTDPKFRGLAKKNRRVKIDNRFQSLFKDPRFLNKVSIDKRGRPESTFNAKENYKRYYQLDQDDDNDDEEDNESDEDNEKTSAKPSTSTASKLPMTDMSVDYARGEGLASDSSSEDDDDDSSDDDERRPGGRSAQQPDEEVFDKWGELDHDAQRTETISARLAVCNMDWDRVGPEDLFLAMASFCPPNGRVQSVRIYLSDFGRQRLADEERLGPEELRLAPTQPDESDHSDFEDQNEDEARLDSIAMERVRRYQVNRLKYYYAVVEFDSPTSANQVYEECDGHEYELSATRFDLRFIPDDMEFDPSQAHSECLSTPNPDTYKPKLFQTTALKQGKVDLTWDETDPDRLAAMQRAFTMNSDDEDNADLKHLVGGASSDEDDENRTCSREIGSGSEDGEDPQEAIAKYKALLSDINQSKNQKRQADADMEMTWTTTDSKIDSQEGQAQAEMTPWEQYLHKRKTKKQAKRERSKQNKDQNNSDDDGDDDVPSDVDLNDPFFRQELAEGNASDSETELPMSKTKKSKRALKKDKKAKAAKAEAEKGPDHEAQADLGLLVMDSDGEKGHFDYKDIVEKEKGKKTRKGRKRKNVEEKVVAEADTFQMDLQDDRFAAVFHNADFNVDPSHPSFKKTKSMQQVIDEKQRRILQSDRVPKSSKSPTSRGQQSTNTSTASKSRQNDHLDVLVKAIKAKTHGAKTTTSKKGAKKRKTTS